MVVKFITFSLVGAIGTMVHYSILYVLVEYYRVDPVLASAWGAFAGLIINYILNYLLIFESRHSHLQTFPKFTLIASMGFCLNVLLMRVLSEHMYYLYAQVLTTGVVLIWNFVANSLWTFKINSHDSASKGKYRLIMKKIFTGLGLLTIIVSIRAITLGLYPLYDPSESRYAEMARKMLETGNWITPFIDYGVPFWGKPPLTIWLGASSLWLGGINDFFVRLPSLLLSFGIAWLVFYVAKIQCGLEKAWTGLLILSSMVLFFVMSGTVAMDVCMNFGITLALASFWLALRQGKNNFWGYLFFIGLSVGLMAKGPIAIVLAGIGIGFWTLITGEWLRVWKQLPWFKGTLLMLVISVPWYMVAEHQTPGFLEYFFIGEHWKRFTESGWTGDLYGTGHARTHGMIWIYWLGAAFPWSLVFLKILLTSWFKKTPLQLISSRDGWRLYCLLWMLSPLLFFTLSANILWTYVLPGLPGFALLLADCLNQPLRARNALILCVPLSVLGLVMVYNFSHVDFFRSQKPLVASYRQLAQTDEKLFYVLERPYSAQFYLQGKALHLAGISDLQVRLDDSNHDFYVIKKNLVQNLPETLKTKLKLIDDFGTFELFHANGNN